MEIERDKAVSVIVYDPERQSVLMGLSNRQWNFASGVGQGDEMCFQAAKRKLAEEFGLKLAVTTKESYNPDSLNIHQEYLGCVVVPEIKSHTKRGIKYSKSVYRCTQICLYVFNKNKVRGLTKGIKSKDIEKIRWVKVKDLLKLELSPASLMVFNVFLSHTDGVSAVEELHKQSTDV